MNDIVLTPAYGRDYKSRKEVEADWEANKDFLVATIGPDSGRYINKQDAKQAGVSMVKIRYDRMTKVTVIAVQ